MIDLNKKYTPEGNKVLGLKFYPNHNAVYKLLVTLQSETNCTLAEWFNKEVIRSSFELPEDTE